MEIIPWNDQRQLIFMDRYALKDKEGNPVENVPEEMWHRVASHIGKGIQESSLFLEILRDFMFVPAGRILAGERALYNCFVLGFSGGECGADSRTGIMNAAKDLIEITSGGGGVGINWSPLRPRDTFIHGVNGRSSGSVSWMRGLDSMANAIRQGGSRTAALMFMLDDWHPDVIEFTRTMSLFERANFSVNVSDEFMEAVQKDKDWNLIFPDTNSPFYDFEWDGDIESWENKDLPIVIHDTIKARDLWRAFAESAHMIGSPGLAFMDRCNTWSNTWDTQRLICFNPCGEQPLPANGSCNLGALNLLSFIKDGEFQEQKFRMSVHYAVRFLDRVIDVSHDVTKEIGDLQRLVRRIGLGTMGLADAMIVCRIKYGSEESLDFIRKIYTMLRDEAYLASIDLAKEKGKSLACTDAIHGSKFISTLPKHIQDQIFTYGLRNMALLTQAPTGTTSILAGVSSGIEPIFSRQYIRTDASGCSTVLHPLAESPFMVTAKEISIDAHIAVQSTVQEFMDASISKTINLPENCTVEEIMEAYQIAYATGCKGITVYRENSLEDDVLCEACEI